ncbi:MAG: alpha/beta hydrolase fold domain-containing protein [Planctomycetota bacterium]
MLLRRLSVALTLAFTSVDLTAQAFRVVPNLVYDQALQLRLDIYLPLNAAPPYPTVVWVHGGGWSAGTRNAVAQANQLCPRGYAVVGIDYRLTGVAAWPAQIHDCKGAIRWLRAHAAAYDLDPDRFGAWGSSAGGHLVACLGTMHGVGVARIGNAVVDLEGTTGGNPGFSSRVQAVCDWYGPTEFVRMREFPTFDHDAPNSPESLLVGGAIQANPDRAATANSIVFLTADDAPLLIMHGTDDTTVPCHQSELLWRAATVGAGIDAAFVPVPGAGHGGPGFQVLIQQVFDLFDQRLRDLPATTVSIVAVDGTASEGGDAGLFRIRRTGAVAQPLLVELRADGSARTGVDVAPLPLLALVPAGAAAVDLPVRPLQDDLVEGDEDVVLRVCPSPAYRIDAAQDAATVVVTDDEAGAALPVVEVTAVDAHAAESGGDSGLLQFTRSGDASAALRVGYRVSGTALNGLDVAALSGSVLIPALATSAQVPVLALPDGQVEKGEYLTVSLVAGATYTLGGSTTAGVVIEDGDRAANLPIVSVALADVTASEDGAQDGVFSISRTGPTTHALSVPFVLTGSAQVGADYVVSAPSPVTIPAGAAWVRVVVQGRQDALAEGLETIELRVGSSAGWQSAGQAADELLLVDDDAPLPSPSVAAAVAPMARGGRLTATLAAGGVGDAFALWLSAARAYLPFGGGALQLDPTAAAVLAAGGLDADGSAVVDAPIPDVPELTGAVVHLQAVTLALSTATLGFSGLATRRIE